MPKFNYVALDSRGSESTGVIEAASSNEAISQLRQAGFFPTSVMEEGKAGARKTAGGKKVTKTFAASSSVDGAKKSKGIDLFKK